MGLGATTLVSTAALAGAMELVLQEMQNQGITSIGVKRTDATITIDGSGGGLDREVVISTTTDKILKDSGTA